MERLIVVSLLVVSVLALSFILIYVFITNPVNILGKVTSTAKLNISVGTGTAPEIVWVNVDSPYLPDLRQGPSNTNITINFTAKDAEGAANLNDSSATVNINRSGEVFRYTPACYKTNTINNYVNYTCNISLFWFDGDGTWTVNASIKDLAQNIVINKTKTLTINTLLGFTSGPGSILFDQINAGATNTSSNNDPLTINNTGNQFIDYNEIEINATNLRGELDNTRRLYSGNFSVGNSTGSNSECYINETLSAKGNATRMNATAGNYVNISQAILPDGNFTIDNGVTGQEQLYFCILLAGSELTPQAYSTLEEGSWTIRAT